MKQERTSVAVLDHDPAMRCSVARLLALNEFDPVTYSSGGALLADLEAARPDCIVADVAMPDLSGLQLQVKLAEADLEYPIVFVTGQADIRATVQAMRGGAVDFLEKPFDDADLLDAVQRALERSRASRTLHTRLASLRQRLSSLTQREQEVFEQVVDGRLNKQIAAQLGITEKTVKVHRARVMRKMAVRSVAHLARIAEQIGIPARH